MFFAIVTLPFLADNEDRVRAYYDKQPAKISRNYLAMILIYQASVVGFYLKYFSLYLD